ITKPTYISLVLVENNSTLNLEKHLQLTLQPLSATDEFTPKQIELLERYKSKGLDLYSLIGDVEMTGTIYFPGDGNLDAL
ncbi:DUF4929 family protein, partial [Vibrio vulnificus]